MTPRAPLSLRRGAFRMFVAEMALPATPHVLLPRPRTDEPWIDVKEWIRGGLVPVGEARLTLKPASVDQPKPPSAEQLRMEKEQLASATRQPFGWGHRTYQSVSGVRWQCCGSMFDEEHSPWCRASGEQDPFNGPVGLW